MSSMTAFASENSRSFKCGDYAQAIRNLCAEEKIKDKVILADLTIATRDLNVELGEGAKWMHCFTAGEYEDEAKTKIIPAVSSVDKTHTNSYGAKMNAWLIGDLTKDTPLGKHFTKKEKPSSKERKAI